MGPTACLSYAQAAAGARHTVLLGSDVGAASCGSNEEGRRDHLAPIANLSYAQAAAGARHTVQCCSGAAAAP